MLNELKSRIETTWRELNSQYGTDYKLYIITMHKFESTLRDHYGEILPEMSYKRQSFQGRPANTHITPTGCFVIISQSVLNRCLREYKFDAVAYFFYLMTKHEFGHCLEHTHKVNVGVDMLKDNAKYVTQCNLHASKKYKTRWEGTYAYYAEIDRELAANELVGLTAKMMADSDEAL
jgi:hypothetical protein